MSAIHPITRGFSVAPALTLEAVAEAHRLGYRALVCNRPDGEEAGQVAWAAMAAEARRLGLEFRFVPVEKLDPFAEVPLSDMAEALAELPQPVLAYCKSGTRSAIAWAAIAVRTRSVDDVLARLCAAGFELGALREDFEAQAEHHAVGTLRGGLTERACVPLAG